MHQRDDILRDGASDRRDRAQTARRLLRGRFPAAIAGCLAVCLFPGCAVVAPYERERLARPDMELGRNVDIAAGEEHATAYREGSTGATGTSGGGCGCN